MDRCGGVVGEAFDQALREECVEFLLFVALVPFADARQRFLTPEFGTLGHLATWSRRAAPVFKPRRFDSPV